MISLITCSVDKTRLEDLKESVKSSIGLDYELIAVDNTISKDGICKVYNEAAARSKYPYLCFIHEDVKFHTQNWGPLMVETLRDESIGILGFCGGKYYPHVPGAWLDIPAELRRFNMVSEVNGQLRYNTVKDNQQDHMSATVTLDGLLLAMRKTTWQEFQFNAEVVKGFEFYDIEICLRTGVKYKLVIDHRIFIEHFGTGRYATKRWITDAFDFYKHKPLKTAASLVNYPLSLVLEDFAFKRFLERVAGIDDFGFRTQIMAGLIIRFPALFIKNIKFYLDVRRTHNSTAT